MTSIQNQCLQTLKTANQTNQSCALNNMDNWYKFDRIKYHFIVEIIILAAIKFFEVTQSVKE